MTDPDYTALAEELDLSPEGRERLERLGGAEPTPDETQPAPDAESAAKAILWALSLACGVAGCLAYGAPAIFYVWPLGLGGASLALAIVAYQAEGEGPWFAGIALIAGLVSLSFGITGYNDIEEARREFERLLR